MMKFFKIAALTLLFYIIGLFAYDHIYRFTLDLIKTISPVPLGFYKFFLPFGDFKFSLIMASIPFTVFLTSKILRQNKYAILISILTYNLYFMASYALLCYLTGLSFYASNDFYRGEIVMKNIKDVDLNGIFLASIFLAILFTSLTFLLAKLMRYFFNNLRKSPTKTLIV